MKEQIHKIVDGHNLTEDESASAMREIMDGTATPAQIAALVTALRMKGETAEEIAGMARVLRQYAVHVPVKTDKIVVDTCGTGGDHLKTFNISTTAALIVAADGRLVVAKHGNRSISSKCGGADVLEALGVRIDLPPAVIGQCVEDVGIGFLFAQAMHPSYKHASGPRKEIGIRTVFNLLGPLANPAGTKIQLIGVSEAGACNKLAHALKNLGSERVLLVHGIDGLDEISTIGRTQMTELKNGEVTTYWLDAHTDLGLARANVVDLGGCETREENAAVLLDILYGTDKGPRRDIVLLNAAGVLYVAGLVDNLADGIGRAAELVDSGAAAATLERLREFTNA